MIVQASPNATPVKAHHIHYYRTESDKIAFFRAGRIIDLVHERKTSERAWSRDSGFRNGLVMGSGVVLHRLKRERVIVSVVLSDT